MLGGSKGLDKCFMTVKNFLDFFPDVYGIQ